MNDKKGIIPEILNRYSVRSYQKREVEEEKLERVIKAGLLAPSACNLQPWRFIIVKDKNKRKLISKACCDQSFVAEAPVIIVCCSPDKPHIMTCGQVSYPIDCAISVDHISLQAVREGLGTCWIGAFYEDQIRKILSIPDFVRIPIILTLGYPADSPPSFKNRRDFKESVFEETWPY